VRKPKPRHLASLKSCLPFAHAVSSARLFLVFSHYQAKSLSCREEKKAKRPARGMFAEETPYRRTDAGKENATKSSQEEGRPARSVVATAVLQSS